MPILFKLIAYLEGLSFLVLLTIAMPMKYIYGNPVPVKTVGSVHGILFIAYMSMLALISSQYEWSNKKKGLGFIAGIVPFGPFLFERYAERID